MSMLALVLVPVAVACYPGNVQGLALTLHSFCFLDRGLLYLGLTIQPHMYKINRLCGLLLGNHWLDTVKAKSQVLRQHVLTQSLRAEGMDRGLFQINSCFRELIKASMWGTTYEARIYFPSKTTRPGLMQLQWGGRKVLPSPSHAMWGRGCFVLGHRYLQARPGESTLNDGISTFWAEI